MWYPEPAGSSPGDDDQLEVEAQKAAVAQRRTVRMEMEGFGGLFVGDLTCTIKDMRYDLVSCMAFMHIIMSALKHI